MDVNARALTRTRQRKQSVAVRRHQEIDEFTGLDGHRVVAGGGARRRLRPLALSGSSVPRVAEGPVWVEGSCRRLPTPFGFSPRD